jgi:hypothetical protein
MDRSYLLLIGALSGLVSVLTHAVLGSLIDMLRPKGRSNTSLTANVDVPDIVLHIVAGIGLALLFWLSWGLAAVVSVRWWVRGLSFGALCWVTLGLPAVISLARSRGITAGPAAVIATQWASTCIVAGLACAWTWARMG